MIYNEIKQQITADDIVIIDFDNTITTKKSETSIGVFSNILDEEYKKQKKIIDKKISITYNDLILRFYWLKKIKLLKRYIKSDSIDTALKYFNLNKRIIDIIKNNKIIICSSGYKDIIKKILIKNGIKYDFLLANDFNSNIFNIITPNNKYIYVERIIKKNKLLNKKYILIGDLNSDQNMLSKWDKKFYKV